MKSYKLLSLVFVLAVLCGGLSVASRINQIRNVAELLGFSYEKERTEVQIPKIKYPCYSLANHVQIYSQKGALNRNWGMYISRFYTMKVLDIFFGHDYCVQYWTYFTSNFDKLNSDIYRKNVN